MLVYIVRKFVSSERINVFHYEMFHGETIPLAAGTHGHAHLLGGDLSQPVRIIRNGWRIPDVFSPDISLIISAQVKDALQSLPNIVFLPVSFEKLVDYPYQAGDFSYYDTPEFRSNPAKANPETLLYRLSDVPLLHRKVKAYYELVVPRLNNIWSAFPDRKDYIVNLPYCSDPIDLQLSRSLVECYPVVWWGAIIFHEVAFMKIEKYLDWDYFSKATLEI